MKYRQSSRERTPEIRVNTGGCLTTPWGRRGRLADQARSVSGCPIPSIGLHNWYQSVTKIAGQIGVIAAVGMADYVLGDGAVNGDGMGKIGGRVAAYGVLPSTHVSSFSLVGVACC